MTLETDAKGETTYWPEDDEWTIYIQSGHTNFSDMFTAVSRKWPDVSLDSVVVTAEHIKTGHVGDIVVDCESDFTCFIVLSVPQETGE